MSHKYCDGVNRRNFLEIGALSGLGLGLPQFLKANANQKTPNNCILIWTRGGTSHHDTLDPKPDAPTSVRGEFGVIDTALPGVKFTEVCPTLAKHADKFSVLRGWNPKNGSHGTADQYVMSGRKFNQAIAYPTFGSVVSYFHGFQTAMPPFIQLGEQIDRRFGGGTSGILGLEYNPFEISADPSADGFVVRDITPPQGVTFERIDRRKNALAKLDALQRKTDLQQEAYAA